MEENSVPVLPLPPEYSVQRRSAIERRIQQIAELLEGKEKLLVLMHNDPDPDAIASARALEELLRKLTPEADITLAHGGMIGRAENRTMAALFIPHGVHIPTSQANEAIKEYDGIMLVDTQPNASNHLLLGTDYPPEEVLLAIDHHPPKRSQTRAKIHDVRPEVGASSTILCEYLAVGDIPLDPRLATALFYGIKSDTLGLSRHTSDLDIWAYSTLRNLIETDLLNRIEHVQLPRTYYRNISEALANTTMYPCSLWGEAEEDEAGGSADGTDNESGNDKSAKKSAKKGSKTDRQEKNGGKDKKDKKDKDANGDDPGSNGNDEAEDSACIGDVAISLLFDMQRPDMASEVADLLMRMEDVSWAICLGIYEDRVVISVRTDDAEARAGRLVRSIVGKTGTAGGHDTMAGGRIHLPNKTPAERIADLHALVPRFLKELGAGDAVGVPLLESK